MKAFCIEVSESKKFSYGTSVTGGLTGFAINSTLINASSIAYGFLTIVAPIGIAAGIAAGIFIKLGIGNY